MTDPVEIDITIRMMIKNHSAHLQIRKDNDSGFEAVRTIPKMQGKQQVDGFYFASTIPKTKDYRLYFFPIYTDAEHFKDINSALRKCLKGKTVRIFNI